MPLTSYLCKPLRACQPALCLSALSLVLASHAWAAHAAPPLAPELEPRLVPTDGKGEDASASRATGADPAGDPPGRVGRLSATTNVVSLRPAKQERFVPALRNRPIVQGDSIFTGPTGRAEMHMGPHVVRLGPNTLMIVQGFDDEQMQLSVPEGVVLVRIRELATGEIVELDVPNAAMVMQHEGVFRADVEADGAQTRFAARSGGEADIIGAGEAWNLHSDELSQIDGAQAEHHAELPVPAFDDLDQWGANRDRSEERPEALKFVSRSTVGYEDLDANGSWEQTQGYGAVWYPTTVDDDWAPYRNGSWSYIEPWGWNWVDEAAWGFAPFHYGRWVRGGNRWGWAPGALGYRPCYAPALVGFLGGPELGLDGETLAWFPLGWNEPYWPGYAASYGYLHRVNAGHFNTTHHHPNQSSYANQRIAGAVTAVRSGMFANGSIIGHNHLTVAAAAQGRATFLGSAPHLTPTQHNGVAMQQAGHVTWAQPQARVLQRPVFHSAQPSGAGASRTGPVITSGNGARVGAYAPHYVGGASHGYGPGQVYRYPQIYRTPVPVGPHHDPGGSYSRPASGGYNAGAAAYHAAPNPHMAPGTGTAAGGWGGGGRPYGHMPNTNYRPFYNANGRYEPVTRPAPASSPMMHSAGMSEHFGGHFGGRH